MMIGEVDFNESIVDDRIVNEDKLKANESVHSAPITPKDPDCDFFLETVLVPFNKRRHIFIFLLHLFPYFHLIYDWNSQLLRAHWFIWHKDDPLIFKVFLFIYQYHT